MKMCDFFNPSLKMLPLALTLIKTKNSENAHLTLELRDFNGWRQFLLRVKKRKEINNKIKEIDIYSYLF